ncbi:MAG TPA: hypothetical protein VGG20_09865 [Thermoanaerobaculia bacterium]|jgi:hypothetical protein
MNRLPRTAGILALTAALLTIAVPAAQARTLAKPQAPSVSGSLFGAALAWLGDLGFGAPSAARTHQAPAMKSDPILPPPPLVPGLMRPMCGSLIDPSGHCGGGGTGG